MAIKNHLLQIICGLLCFGAVQANDIYRWVDETGHVQVSDVVPDKYLNIAKKLNAGRDAVTSDDHRDALLRAAAEKQRLEDIVNKKARDEAAATVSLQGAAQPPVKAASDCLSLQKAYESNQECYAPFHNVSGGLKPGALSACGPGIEDPSPKCGIPKWTKTPDGYSTERPK